MEIVEGDSGSVKVCVVKEGKRRSDGVVCGKLLRVVRMLLNGC